MSRAPKTEDYEEDVDYVNQDEDDSDDEEDDFVPGTEIEEEEDGEDDIVPLLDGYLYVDDSQSLHYQGDGFHLSSSEPPPWNVIGPAARKVGDSVELIMTGPCDFESAETKATPRKMKVTFTVVSSADIDPILGELATPRQKAVAATADHHLDNENDHNAKPAANLKADPSKDSNDEDNAKVKAAPSDGESSSEKQTALVHRVFGQQMDTHGGDAMEFMGVFYPPKSQEEQVSLTCQVRMIPAAPATPAASATAAVAAASANSARIDKEDDEDEEYEEYEEGVEPDELIALHEDAGMSVDALQKRYRESSSPAGANTRSKRAKPPPKSADDDEEDYGF